jgi:uncharacterized membrane protein (UPF0127 family)
MRFSIDVLFLDKDFRVMRAVSALAPFRTSVVRQAVYVLELPVGAIQTSGTEAGDQIQVQVRATGETTTIGKVIAPEKISVPAR